MKPMIPTPYWKKLQDPRWQKKRLEVFERDGFTCQACGSKTDTLQVHHNHYVAKREPWEYPTGTLTTLCVNCHKAQTEITSNETYTTTWEAFIEIEHEAMVEGFTTSLVAVIEEKSRAMSITRAALMNAIATALLYDLIDQNTIMDWKIKIDRLEIVAINEEDKP